ncbi:MAG: T9SS type A sorting domain-containing protein [Gemmatimonadaceae bacterium]|nr:T9SS type A sorting domain-containing protein [Chitinophagaceae bacterium]
MKRPLPNYFFSILIILTVSIFAPVLAVAQSVDYGKSYFNVTKGTTGGTVEPGDTLEIRATFVVRSGATADSCAFYDNVPPGTAYIPSTLKVLTNEAKVYKTLSDASGDDVGRIAGSAITINLGFNPSDNPATPTKRGRVKATDKPSFYNSACILVASYRVRVLAAYGTTLNIGGGSATYKLGAASTQTIIFGAIRVFIFRNYGICPNSIGANALGAEFNGTFGGGKPRNRGTSASIPGSYVYNFFNTNGPQDYFYGIANNTSTRTNYTTSNAWPKPDGASPTHRVFTVWDIIGDHTGAVSPTAGNPAADTVNNNNGGYMLVINASYKTDSAFRHTITNLCPNTYYELSAWFRNICSRCGCDSMGRGAGSLGYIPTAAGDSSGVYPSLIFEVDGIDYYSTGLIKYSGQWIKKGFTYLTGPAQTSLTYTVRNNAPGGGGNDWAIDDISVATCTPNLNLFPSPTVNACYGNQVDMYTVVRCFFSNYIYWRWEESTNGGATWSNTGVGGTATPVLNAGEWEYTATYPSFIADSAVHNRLFRIRVASTAANLNDPNCSFYASTTIRVWVNNCGYVLSTKLKSFDARLQNKTGQLYWTTEDETGDLHFEIERSTDGIHFENIGRVEATAADGEGNSYTFTDDSEVNGTVYYRIKMSDGNSSKYSRVVSLNSHLLKLDIRSVQNPFVSQISFEMLTPADQTALVIVFDNYGREVKRTREQLHKGVNTVLIPGLGGLSSGSYVLRVEAGGQVINRKLIKASK